MKRVLPIEKSVINDKDDAIMPVINNGISGELAAFKVYANKVRELAKIRGLVMKSGWWWRRVEPQLRQFLLWQLLEDEGLRYADSEWSAMPEPLRTRISAESRRLVRYLDGCPWR